MEQNEKEQVLKMLLERMEKQQQNVNELREHPALRDSRDSRHTTYVGYLNTAKGALNATKELYESLAQSKEPYQEEISEGLDEIAANVEKVEHAYNESMAEFDAEEAEANQALKESDPDLIMQMYEEMNQRFGEQQESNFYFAQQQVFYEGQIDELKQTVEMMQEQNQELVAQIMSLQKQYAERLQFGPKDLMDYLKEVSKSAMNKAIKPFSYAYYQFKTTMESIHRNISDMKDNVKLTKASYEAAMKNGYSIATTKVKDAVSTMVTAAGYTATKVAEGAANLYKNTMNTARELFEKGKNVIRESKGKLLRAKNIMLDTMTLGIYSNVQKNKSIKEMTAFINEANKTAEAGVHYDVQKNIASIEDYWKDIQNSNPIWGNKAAHEIGKTLGYHSPSEFIYAKLCNAYDTTKQIGQELSNEAKQDYADAKDFVKQAAKDTVEKINDVVEKTGDAVRQAFTTTKEKATALKDSVKNEISRAENNVHASLLAYDKLLDAKVLETKAAVVSGIAKLYSMSDRRIESRIKQLHQADHEIFEANSQVRKILHNMTEITPYTQKNYETSQEVRNLTENLRATLDMDVKEASLLLAKSVLPNQAVIVEQYKNSTNPACQAAYNIANRTLEKEAAKQEKMLLKDQKLAQQTLDKIEKAEAKAEKAHNLSEAKKAMETDMAIDKQFNDQIDAYNTLMDNKDELAANQAKIAEAKEKLEHVREEKDAKLEQTKDMKEQAATLRQEAQELLDNRDIRE